MRDDQVRGLVMKTAQNLYGVIREDNLATIKMCTEAKLFAETLLINVFGDRKVFLKLVFYAIFNPNKASTMLMGLWQKNVNTVYKKAEKKNAEQKKKSTIITPSKEII
jgi:hypothetical protein